MKTSSAKAKGRRLQQLVRDDLRTLAPQLDPTDIESTTMGLSGVDIVLTAAARQVFGELAFECKNVEKLNAIGVFQEHHDKYAPKGKIPIMVHSRNHTAPRVTLLWSDFVRLYLSAYLTHPQRSQARLEIARRNDARKFTSFAVDEGLEPKEPGMYYDKDGARGPVFNPIDEARQEIDRAAKPIDEGTECQSCSDDNRAIEHCPGAWRHRQEFN